MTKSMTHKIAMKPSTMLNPVPAVLVSCGSGAEQNLLTAAWTGIINSQPPMTYVSVKKERWSHPIIAKSGEFVINLTTEAMAEAVDFCGVRSGRDMDKFARTGLTPQSAELVACPMVAESPVNMECRVTEVKTFPSHDMFIAEILRVHVAEDLFDENGRIALEQAGLLAYCHGGYFGLKSAPLGSFGYSVMKPKTRKRRRQAAAKHPRHTRQKRG